MTSTLTGNALDLLVAPRDLGITADVRRYTPVHDTVVSGQQYTCAGFSCTFGNYLAGAGHTGAADCRGCRQVVSVTALDFHLSTSSGGDIQLVVRDFGTEALVAVSNVVTLPASNAYSSAPKPVHVTFPSPVKLPTGRSYDFRFLSTSGGSPVYRSDVVVYMDPNYSVSGFSIIRGTGEHVSVSGFVRGSSDLLVEEARVTGSFMLTEAVDLAAAFMGANMAYTNWVEPLAAADQAGGSSIIYFTPSAFTELDECAVRAVTITTSSNTGQLPMCNVYAWIVDDYAPSVALSISEPVYISRGDTAYTFLFGAPVSLTGSGQYRIVFRSTADAASVPVTVPIKLSADQGSAQSIRYGAAPDRRPVLRILYSNPEIMPLSGVVGT